MNPLVRPGGAVDQGGGGFAGEAGGLQFGRDGVEAGDAHVDDDCLIRLGEGLPVEVDGMVLEVAGDEDAALRMLTMREREAKAGGGAEGGSDAGNNFNGYAGGGEDVHFFAAPPENEGIAALEANHKLACERLFDEQLADVVLRHGVIAGHLADKNAFGRRRDEFKNPVADEIVVDDDLGLLQQARAFERDQFGVAGAGSDKGNVAAARGCCVHGIYL